MKDHEPGRRTIENRDDDQAARKHEVARLTIEMDAAAAALDFERARTLRDQLNLMRGGATFEEAVAADTSGLERQQPGKMGLGTSQQRMTPPTGWKAPPKPDPMTRNKRRGRG